MGQTQSGRILNWKRPSLPHHSVQILSSKRSFPIPPKMDLRSKDTPIFDQGQQGSCTMNAGCGLYDYLKQGRIVTSREFGYYNELVMDGNPGIDAGSSLDTCSKVFLELGVCQESLWTYPDHTLDQKPTDEAYQDALTRKIAQRISINQDLITLRQCLAQGYPFIYGQSVYESFEDAPNGIVPYPGFFEKNMGGHALMCVGYDDSKQWFIVRNSWGTSYGQSGYCFIPYKYLTNRRLADDFWTFRL